MLSQGELGEKKVTAPLPNGEDLSAICNRVAELTEIAVIREFCEFIVSGLGDKTLPDYATIDLMQVPRLAPNMFVHDYRDGIEQGLLVKFSGTAIDEHYGRVLQGRYVEENYTGSDGPDHYFPLHRRAIAERRPFFAKRSILFDQGSEKERFKQSTTLYFPCSSDGQTVNFGIGAVVFETVRDDTEALYLTL